VTGAHNLGAIERNRYQIVPSALKDVHPKPIVSAQREDNHAGSIPAGPQRFNHIHPRTIGEIAICKDDLDLMVDHFAQALNDIAAPKQSPTGAEDRAFQGTEVLIIRRGRQDAHRSLQSSTRKTFNHVLAFLFLLLSKST
jgi:hypothetical protein